MFPPNLAIPKCNTVMQRAQPRGTSRVAHVAACVALWDFSVPPTPKPDFLWHELLNAPILEYKLQILPTLNSLHCPFNSMQQESVTDCSSNSVLNLNTMIHYEYSLNWALAHFILGQFISYTSYQRNFIQDFFLSEAVISRRHFISQHFMWLARRSYAVFSVACGILTPPLDTLSLETLSWTIHTKYLIRRRLNLRDFIHV